MTRWVSSLRLQAQWTAIDRAWENARVLGGGPDTLAKMGPLMNAVAELLSTLEDRSGLSYDPSIVAQNLADVYMHYTVSGVSGTRRLESISAMALQRHGLTLSERLDAAGNLMNLREAFDLTREQLPSAVANLNQLAPPERAQWEALPSLAQRMEAAGDRFLDLVVHSVMLQPSPTISATVLHRNAASAVDAGKQVWALSGKMLDASLAARGRIQSERNRYLYLAFVLGAILVVGIMVSVAQLIARRDRALLREALREAARLQAELAPRSRITESVVLDAGTRANQTIGRVRERGFKICIDDFGTGYSSLRYLQQFEVDAIKIDRSFVCGADGRLASEPIVRTLISLAEAYNVRIVAEGVETAEQCEMLRNAGCRLGQGFLFAPALAPAEITERYPDVLGRIARSASA